MSWVLAAVAIGGFVLAFVSWRGSPQASRLRLLEPAAAPVPLPHHAPATPPPPSAPPLPAAPPPPGAKQRMHPAASLRSKFVSRFFAKPPLEPTLEVLVLLDADVRAGVPPAAALAHALAEVGTDFYPQTQAACASGVGIAETLKIEATARGETSWAAIAACWLVSERYGASLSSMLKEVIGVTRRNHRATNQLRAQLAAPVAGAKLLAGLPLLGIGLGFLLGANPIAWLLGNPIGWLVAAVAIAFEAAGIFWVRRIMRSAMNPARFRDAEAAATVTQLIAALLKSGVTVVVAIEAAAEATAGPLSERLSLVARRLRLGAEPEAAWGALVAAGNLRLLAKVLIRSSHTGASVHQSLGSVVEYAQDKLSSDLEARARAAGVRAVAPLALCFLPAFMLVTVVPIVGSLLPTVLQFPAT